MAVDVLLSLSLQAPAGPPPYAQADSAARANFAASHSDTGSHQQVKSGDVLDADGEGARGKRCVIPLSF